MGAYIGKKGTARFKKRGLSVARLMVGRKPVVERYAGFHIRQPYCIFSAKDCLAI